MLLHVNLVYVFILSTVISLFTALIYCYINVLNDLVPSGGSEIIQLDHGKGFT